MAKLDKETHVFIKRIQQSDGLDSFPQAHFVSQDRIDVIGITTAQPVQPFQLVWVECRFGAVINGNRSQIIWTRTQFRQLKRTPLNLGMTDDTIVKTLDLQLLPHVPLVSSFVTRLYWSMASWSPSMDFTRVRGSVDTYSYPRSRHLTKQPTLSIVRTLSIVIDQSVTDGVNHLLLRLQPLGFNSPLEIFLVQI